MKRYLAADIGGTDTKMGRVSVTGERGHEKAELEEFVKFPSSGYSDADALIDNICDLLLRIRTKGISGLAVACRGQIDDCTGMVVEIGRLGFLKGYPLKERMEGIMELPTIVRNDAASFTMGEWAFGHEERHETLVGVVIATGVGSCYLRNGDPIKGRTGRFGEIGMIEVDGKRLDDHASGNALEEISGMSGEELYRSAMRGDEAALGHFVEYGRRAGEVVML